MDINIKNFHIGFEYEQYQMDGERYFNKGMIWVKKTYSMTSPKLHKIKILIDKKEVRLIKKQNKEPKDKAKELVDRFCKHQSDDYPNSDEDYHAKQCALICIDEKIASVIRIKHPMNTNRMNRRVDRIVSELEEVKQEINKL
jgi:hypothetical protein